MSDVLPNPQINFYPKTISTLLNRLNQFFLCHVDASRVSSFVATDATAQQPSPWHRGGRGRLSRRASRAACSPAGFCLSQKRNSLRHLARSRKCRFCSLIPGFGVKLSTIILAGPTVLSAVGACPPHDGVRRRWWINVASAVSLIKSSQKIGRSHHRHRPGRDVLSRRAAGTL